MNRKIWLTSLIGLMVLGCGDDSVSADTDDETDTEESTTTTTTTATTTTTTPTTSTTEPLTSTTTSETDTTGPDTDPTTDGTSSSSSSGPEESSSSSSSTGPEEKQEPVDFTLTIENISGNSLMPGPFSPGVWVEQAGVDQPIFSLNSADRGLGLVEIAEDGDPTILAGNLMGQADVISSGVFNTPVDAAAPAPILPGESYEVTFTAQPESRLSFVTMLVQTNDIFLGTAPTGISLFGGNGAPLGLRDVSGFLEFWDVGSEANQPPRAGGYQAPDGVGIGPDESGVISLRNEATHAIPLASKFTNVEVTYDAVTMEFTIEIENITDATGSLLSTFSPASWALHDDTFTGFTPGAVAVAGLEDLAEDGDPAGLQATWAATGGFAEGGVTAPALPGGSIIITVTPVVAGRFFSFATMVTETNDVFLAAGPGGVALLNDMGGPRSTGAIETDFEEMLRVWDAGTEANQAPGVGADIAENQDFPNTGAVDTDTNVRPYFDETDALAGPAVGGFLIVNITNGANLGDFDVVIENSSGGDFGGVLTPAAWAVHDGTYNIGAVGTPASLGLEELAEDGAATTLNMQAGMDAGVLSSGIEGAGPIGTGGLYTFAITADAANSWFNFATMIVPSNDTFVSLGGLGIDLFDGATPLTDEQLATAIEAALAAYDAGTEQNQAGGAGRDMAPIGGANTGANEGTGMIRQAETDPVWAYPAAEDLVRVTIEPTP